jgi:hypothetical protein
MPQNWDDCENEVAAIELIGWLRSCEHGVRCQSRPQGDEAGGYAMVL